MDSGTSRAGTSERESSGAEEDLRRAGYDMPTSVTRPWAPLEEKRRVRRPEPARQERPSDGGRPQRAPSEKHGGVGEQVGGMFVVRVVKRYLAANGSTMAINIAWNTLFAFFPIILLITTVLTAILGGSDVSNAIDKNIQNAIPGTQGAEIVQALHSFHKASGALFIISFVGLIWSGTSLFGAMDQGLNALEPASQRSFIRQKVMGVVMIAVFTVLVALDVGSASLLALVTNLPQMPGFIRSGAAATGIQIAFGFFDGLLLFGAIYLVVPNRRHKLSEVVPGAVVAAALFEAFTLLFPLYFKLQHGFSTYGSTFALFFLLLTFAFWLAQIIMFGAAVNAERHPPEPGAFPNGQQPPKQGG